MQVDLSSVDFSVFKKREIESPYLPRKMIFYDVEFDLVTVMEDDLGYMYFRTVVGGKLVGESRFRFGSDNAAQE